MHISYACIILRVDRFPLYGTDEAPVARVSLHPTLRPELGPGGPSQHTATPTQVTSDAAFLLLAPSAPSDCRGARLLWVPHSWPLPLGSQGQTFLLFRKQRWT